MLGTLSEINTKRNRKVLIGTGPTKLVGIRQFIHPVDEEEKLGIPLCQRKRGGRESKRLVQFNQPSSDTSTLATAPEYIFN